MFARQLNNNLEQGPQGTGLYVVDLDGRDVHPLMKGDPDGNEVKDWFPAWSPGGDRIAFVRETPPRPGSSVDAEAEDSIWLVDSDGSSPRQLVGGLRHVQMLSWSPDGRRLAYGIQVNRVDAPTYTVEIGHPTPKQVAATALDPSWSADGQSLLYYQGSPVRGSLSGAPRIIRHDLTTGRAKVVDIGTANIGYLYFHYDIDAVPAAADDRPETAL